MPKNDCNKMISVTEMKKFIKSLVRIQKHNSIYHFHSNFSLQHKSTSACYLCNLDHDKQPEMYYNIINLIQNAFHHQLSSLALVLPFQFLFQTHTSHPIFHQKQCLLPLFSAPILQGWCIKFIVVLQHAQRLHIHPGHSISGLHPGYNPQ